MLSQEQRKALNRTVFKDEQGRALSLYHWTDVDFEIFSKGDIGFHFGTLDAAYHRYEDLKDKKSIASSVVKEVYLNMENPVVIAYDPMTWDVFSASYKLNEQGILSNEELQWLETLDGFYRSTYDCDAAVELRRLLKEKGYDGIVYANDYEGDWSVIAFRADQIITAENHRAKEADATIYWNTKKSQEMSVSLGVQFPNAITNLDSNVIIRKAKAFVNTQPQKKDVENHGKNQPDDTWSRTLVEEIAHLSEGSEEYARLIQFLASDQKLFNTTLHELSGEGNGYGFTRELAERAINKLVTREALTAKEQSLIKELNAHMAAKALGGNALFIERLVRSDTTLAEKLLNRITDAKRRLQSLKSAEARQAYSRMIKAERLYLNAVSKAGMTYRSGKIMNWEEEEPPLSFSLRYTTTNRAVAVIEQDIFNGRFHELSDQERIKIVKNEIKKFRPGIPVSGRFINVTRKTAEHFVNSDYTDKLRNHDSILYEDKFNVAQNINDVIYASTEYINEELKHSRRDNIVQFARGTVLLEIGGRQYAADVVVGNTAMNEMLLYDIQNLTSTHFELKKQKAHPTLAGNESDTRKTDAPSKNSISDFDENVNPHVQFSRMNSRSFSDNIREISEMTDEEARVDLSEGNFISVMKKTPSVILDHVKDAEDLEVVVRFDAIYLATRKNGVANGHYHGLGVDVASRLPEFISNPDAIIRLDNGRINLLTEFLDENHKQGIISVELNTVKDIHSQYSKYNLVVSAFNAKHNYIKNILQKAVKVEYRKEDLSQVNPQLYEWLAIVNEESSENSIPDSSEKVNPQAKKDSRDQAELRDTQGKAVDGDAALRYGKAKKSLKDHMKGDSESFAKQVDEVLNGKDTMSTHLKVADTPLLLQQAGLPDLPILMTAKHVKTITAKNGSDDVHYHGLDLEIVKQLPKYLKDPVLIADSFTRDDSIVVLTEAIDSQNRPVMAAIKLNGVGQVQNRYIKANVMTSAYGKDNIQSFLAKIANANATIYWNDKKSQEMSVNLGVQFPNIITHLDSNVIIRKAKAFVNTQPQKKDVENHGKNQPDDTWSRTLVEEIAHLLEDSEEYARLIQFLASDQKLFNTTLHELSGEGNGYGFTRELAERAINQMGTKEALTAKEQSLIKELNAHMAAKALGGNALFIERLVRSDTTLAEKLLNRITDAKRRLQSLKSAEARQAYSRMLKAEKLYLNAVSKAGMTYRNGRIMNWEEEEIELSRQNLSNHQDNSPKKFSEVAIATALYDALDHKDSGDDNLIRVSRMPRYVVEKFGIDGDFYVYRDHIYENMVSKEQAQEDGRPTRRGGKSIHFHDLNVERMTEAILSLNEPIMTIKVKSNEGNPTVVMMLPVEGDNGAPLYAVLSFYADRPINGRFETKPHVVLSISPRAYFESEGSRKGWAEFISEAIEENRILDYNKKRGYDLSVIAQQARLGNITEASLNHNIAQFRKEVNDFKQKNKISYSLKNKKMSENAELENSRILQEKEHQLQFSRKKSTGQIADNEMNDSIRKAYISEIDRWDKNGRHDGETFILGSTGSILQGLGAIENDIFIHGDKVKKILIDHPEMTLDIIKKLPQILENPALVLSSKGVGAKKKNSRMILYGNIKAENGQPVLTVLDLKPIEDHLLLDDLQKVNSAYTKTNNPEEWIRSSEVLYADQKKTAKLFRAIGLQYRPIALQDSGFIGSISYQRDVVNISGKKFSDVFAIPSNEIKRAEVSKQGTTENGVAQGSRSATISIPNLMRNVNPPTQFSRKSTSSAKFNVSNVTKNRRTANRSSTDLSRPVGNAMKNSSSIRSISHFDENVNPQDVNFTKYFPKDIVTVEQKRALEEPFGQRQSNIEIDMSEEERARLLKNTKIIPCQIQIAKDFDMNALKSKTHWKDARKPLLNKLRELGFLKSYQAEAIDVDFEFTGEGLKKSVNSQIFEYGGNLADLSKVVMNLQTLLDHAVLIEIHSDKAKGTPKENSRLLRTYVLLSAFREEQTITLVQFEVKQYVDNDNRLYLAVALTKTETSVKSDTAHLNGERTRLVPVSDITIPRLRQKVNSKDKNSFKYVPNEALAVASTKKETGVKSDTILENQASTRLLPVSNITIPRLRQKVNPKDKNSFKYVPNEALAVAPTKTETGVISDTAHLNGERTRLVPVSNITIPRLRQKVNPKDKNSSKYVPNESLAVASTKTETGVISDTILENQASTRLLPVSGISIPQLIQKVNPKDKNFFKYVPNEFLNEAQRKSKREALRQEARKYGRVEELEPERTEEINKEHQLQFSRKNSAQQTEKNEVGNQRNLYSIQYPRFSNDELQENREIVAKMNPIIQIDASRLIKTGKKPSEIFSEFFEAWGGNIYSDTFGNIAVKQSSVKSEIRHGITSEKIASIEAIPTVIQKGKVIYRQQKEAGVERLIVSAPILIGDKEYLMGVMLQRDAQNQRLYLHNVVIKEEGSRAQGVDLLTTGTHQDDDRLFITSILQMVQGVNPHTQFSRKNSAQQTEKNEKSANGTVFDEDKYFKNQMNRWETLQHGSYVKVGEIYENHPLCQIGMPSGDLRYDVDQLKKNMSDHHDYLHAALLKKIPEIIAEPMAISEYREENTVSVFGNVFVGASPMMVGITVSKDRAGNRISKVRTYNTTRDVGNLITDETILYLNEDRKRTRMWFQACGIQVPLGGKTFGFIRSISKTQPYVNTSLQFSRKNSSATPKRRMSEGQLAKLRANYLGERVFEKKAVSGALDGIEALELLSAQRRNELKESIWRGFNQRLDAESLERYGEASFYRIHATVMQELGYELSHRESLEMDEQILRALRNIAESGKPSIRSKMIAENSRDALARRFKNQADYWRERYDKSERLRRDWQVKRKVIDEVVYQAKKIKDVKLGSFLNASQYKSDIFKRSIEALSHINFRETLNLSGTRRIIADLRLWYQRENPVLCGNFEDNGGLYSQSVANAMDQIVENDKRELTTEELRLLSERILPHFLHIVKTWNHVYKNGKYTDARELSVKYVDKLRKNEREQSRLSKLLCGYLRIFGDPASVVRSYDRYDKEGVATQIFEEWREGTIGAEIDEAKLREEFEDFFSGKNVVEISENSELANRIANSSKSKYTVIKEYLVEKLSGYEFTLSDGKKAIMDRSDAKELSHKANEDRIAQLGNLKKLVEKAKYDHSDTHVEHNKFSEFHYYTITVRYQNETFPLWINVGVAKNDGKNHIYAITNKKEGAPTHYGVDGPVGNRLQNASSNNSISDFDENVKPQEQKMSPSQYRKHFTKDTVKYMGKEIPVRVAIALCMTQFRRSTWASFCYSGFDVRIDNRRTEFPPLAESAETDTRSLMGEEQMQRLIEKSQRSLLEQLNEQDRTLIFIVERAFQQCAALKENTDKIRYGYSNLLKKDYYFPVQNANVAINEDSFFAEVDRVMNMSFNKGSVKGARGKLLIEPLDVVFDRHVRGVALYANMAIPVDNFNRILNCNVTDDPNRSVSVLSEMKRTEEGRKMLDYLIKLKRDIEGMTVLEKDTRGFQRLVKKVRGAYVKFHLGLNFKSWLMQNASLLNATELLSYESVLRGMTVKGSISEVDQYCPLARVRHKSKTAVLAQGVLEKTDRIGDATMKHIEWQDRRVIGWLFGACQIEVERLQGLALGTEENKKAAGELLKTVILETQQNSLFTERSAAMRSGSEVLKGSAMFSADSMKNIGRSIDGLGETIVLYEKKKIASPEEREWLEKQLKAAKRKFIKAMGASISVAVYSAIIAQLLRDLFRQDEDKEPEEILLSMSADMIGNMLSGLPIVRDVYSYFSQGYESEHFLYSSLNELLQATDGLREIIEKGDELTDQQIAYRIRRVLYAGGQVLGLPVRNTYNLASGIIRRISPATGYRLDGVFYAPSYKKDLLKAIENDDDQMIAAIAEMMTDEKLDDPSETTEAAVRELVAKGYTNMMPRTLGSTVTYGGQKIELTEKQKKQLRAVYGGADESVSRLVSLPQYQSAEDEVKARAIQFIYDAYYSLAIQTVLGTENGKIALFAKAIDIETLAMIISTARGIEADVDRNGNAVQGSRKEKIVRYIDSLRLSAAEKHMVLGFLGYRQSKGREKVEAYIRTLKLSSEETTALMEWSGYAA